MRPAGKRSLVHAPPLWHDPVANQADCLAKTTWPNQSLDEHSGVLQRFFREIALTVFARKYAYVGVSYEKTAGEPISRIVRAGLQTNKLSGINRH